MPGWVERLRVRLGVPVGRPADPDVYQGLRSMALGIDEATIAMPDSESWSGALVAAMELALSGGTATIVAIADGSVSMYLSSGGGVIGAGGHAAVRAAAQRFRTVVGESRGLLESTEDFPLPEPGQVRFHARIAEAGYTAVASEAALKSGRHPLAPMYASGQDLLTEIRLSMPA
jgi:hypothetical protein